MTPHQSRLHQVPEQMLLGKSQGFLLRECGSGLSFHILSEEHGLLTFYVS